MSLEVLLAGSDKLDGSKLEAVNVVSLEEETYDFGHNSLTLGSRSGR